MQIGGERGRDGVREGLAQRETETGYSYTFINRQTTQ